MEDMRPVDVQHDASLEVALREAVSSDVATRFEHVKLKAGLG